MGCDCSGCNDYTGCIYAEDKEPDVKSIQVEAILLIAAQLGEIKILLQELVSEMQIARIHK